MSFYKLDIVYSHSFKHDTIENFGPICYEMDEWRSFVNRFADLGLVDVGSVCIYTDQGSYVGTLSPIHNGYTLKTEQFQRDYVDIHQKPKRRIMTGRFQK